jgi:predicted nucleic acid-binding protein
VTPLFLDTSAYVAFKRGDPPVLDRIRRARFVVLNPVVLGELKALFAGGGRSARNRDELREFLASPRVRVVAIDEETSERYADIVEDLRRRGRPIPTNDLWIAASAMQHGLRMLTRDRHFAEVRQIVLDPVDEGS